MPINGKFVAEHKQIQKNSWENQYLPKKCVLKSTLKHCRRVISFYYNECRTQFQCQSTKNGMRDRKKNIKFDAVLQSDELVTTPVCERRGWQKTWQLLIFIFFHVHHLFGAICSSRKMVRRVLATRTHVLSNVNIQIYQKHFLYKQKNRPEIQKESQPIFSTSIFINANRHKVK